jgi:glycerophosphoryl diester phosphodiesterase
MNPLWKVAHRGWHDLHIENTLEAFRAAYDAGCDMVEFDVQLTRDGVPVIFHDDDCKRLAGRRRMSWP